MRDIISADMQNTAPIQPIITDDTTVTLLPTKKRARIWELDFLRGICVILMILDHLTMLLGEYFGPSWYGNMTGSGAGESFCRFCAWWQDSSARDIAHPIVVFTFFAISGISCTFSRSNFKRGLQLTVVALIYSGATYIAQELMGINGVLVTFGVLNFLAACMLIYALIEFIGRKNRWFTALASVAIIIVTLCLYFLYTPPKDTPKIFAIIFPPRDFYGNRTLFYSQSDFSPGDLFTMIPYSAFYFFGAFIAQFIYSRRRSLLPCLDRSWHKPISFIGKHALIIYVLHVVLLGALLALISYLFITPGDWGF